MGKRRTKKGWYVLNTEKSQSFLAFARGERETYDNNYCGKLQRFLDGRKGPQRTAIDVGAAYGFVTEHLSGQFEEIKSFEVSDDIRECLKLNVESREMTNVEVFPCGLSDHEGKETVYMSKEWTGHTSKYKNRDIHRSSDRRTFDVKTLDSFNFQNVDLIKIDVEGAELEVIQGGLKTITTWRPSILVEVSIKNPDCVTNAYRLMMLMESLKYKYHRTIGGDFIFIPED